MKSKIFKRFGFYFVGFGIGLIIVLFFFQNRGCSWLPDNRVKNVINERIILCDSITNIKLAALEISKKNILDYINKADVDFSESQKKGDPKVFKLLLKTIKGEKSLYFLYFENTFYCEVFLDKKEINQTQQHLERKIVLSIPEKGNYTPSIQNKDRNNKKLQKINIENQNQLIKKLKNDVLFCDIHINQDSINMKSLLHFKLNKNNTFTSLKFIGDNKQVVFDQISN